MTELLLLSCFSLSLLLISCKSSETDRLALLAFRDNIDNDPMNILTSSWNNSVHFCLWHGVSCSNSNGRVTSLNLPSLRLSGTLSPHIGNLTFLRVITLNTNFFRGELPQQLGHLTSLRNLSLMDNAFEGRIPSTLSNCSSLQVIALGSNKLTGVIPSELSSLRNLSVFRLYKNSLTGSIPSWIGNATSLMVLSLAANSFEGSLPTQLGRLNKLILLQVRENNLSGTVPSSVYNLSLLQYLDIAYNQLHGTIPSDIGSSLFNLYGLFVGMNHFTGLLPVSLPNASRLEQLSFGFSNFHGTVPENLGRWKNLSWLFLQNNSLVNDEGGEFRFLSSIVNCSKLENLNINNNLFSGKLPSSVANLSDTLAMLTAGGNRISGGIPQGMESLRSLEILDLDNNAISGTIPGGLGYSDRLQYLYLNENRISGSIPASLGNMTQLLRLYLEGNDLEGNIPSTLGNCKQLAEIDLGGNKLTGKIPSELASLSSITTTFNLSRNLLTGGLPPGIGNMTKLLQLDLSINMLSGEIPDSLGACEMLEELYLNGNSFEGSFPFGLSKLKSIKTVDLSRNNLSGRIPTYFLNFTLLRLVNLSYNGLEGEVPREGIFTNQSGFSVVGNRKLCGGVKSLRLPACQVDKPKRRGVSLVLKIAIPVAVLASILLAVISLYLCFERRKAARSRSKPPCDDEQLLAEQFPRVSYAELSQATNGFSSSNLIGQGGHGSVYKGVMSSNGSVIVAVKVLNLTQKGAVKSFIAECNALRNIRHRNLVKLITACSSIDRRGHEFKALVFEFMPNGSLEDWLHLHLPESSERRGRRGLSLTQRLDIAIGVASAIEYLHHHCEVPIVHGDLKPSNILLDDEMTPHVGGFGLAKLLPLHPLNNKASQDSTSGFKGTLGYVAPEYGMGGKVSIQGDVYSFGIVLLEMFTGKRPTNDLFNNGVDLHRYVKMALPGRVSEIVHPSTLATTTTCSSSEVDGNGSRRMKLTNGVGESAETLDCVAALLRIGVCCSVESPGERMNMNEAVTELIKIKYEYTRGGNKDREGGTIPLLG